MLRCMATLAPTLPPPSDTEQVAVASGISIPAIAKLVSDRFQHLVSRNESSSQNDSAGHGTTGAGR